MPKILPNKPFLTSPPKRITPTRRIILEPFSSPMSASIYKTTPYSPPTRPWPYKPSDFTRQDSTPDSSFYSAPRFVTHIDKPAIEALQTYYDSTLPRSGRILDFCSSWVSHFPSSMTSAIESGELKVVGMGMNAAELGANPHLTGGRILQDLNVKPEIEGVEGQLNAATCVVSIDYLTQPVEVLKGLKENMNIGGSVHLVVSNRCFPTKAVGRWLRVGEKERLEMVGDYLVFAGWKEVEIVELSNGRVSDPLWVVRGVKKG